jgi:hypothetical protein
MSTSGFTLARPRLTISPLSRAQTNEIVKSRNDVEDMREATGLLAIAVDDDGLASECLIGEPWDNHAVVFHLSRPHGIEEACDNPRQTSAVGVGADQELIDGFGHGIGPTWA